MWGRGRDRGGITLEFALMSIVPVAILLFIFMLAVLVGVIKAADEAAREGARTYARYYVTKGANEAVNMAKDAAVNAFNAKAPPGSELRASDVSFTEDPGVSSTYRNMRVSVVPVVRAPFVGETRIVRAYTFPLESFRKQELLW